MPRPYRPLLPLFGTAYLLAWNTWVRLLRVDKLCSALLQHLHLPSCIDMLTTAIHRKSLLLSSDLEIPAPPPPLLVDDFGVCDDCVAPLPPPVDDETMAPLHYLDKGTSVQGTCTTSTGTV